MSLFILLLDCNESINSGKVDAQLAKTHTLSTTVNVKKSTNKRSHTLKEFAMHIIQMQMHCVKDYKSKSM